MNEYASIELYIRDGGNDVYCTLVIPFFLPLRDKEERERARERAGRKKENKRGRKKRSTKEKVQS